MYCVHCVSEKNATLLYLW